MSRRDQSFGKWGENQAILFLQRKGFRIIDRNFFTSQGEIDVVAQKHGDHYFIEVKSRFKGELANDLAITSAKKHKLEKTVKRYCYAKSLIVGSFIMAGLLVIVDRPNKRLSFRLAAYC